MGSKELFLATETETHINGKTLFLFSARNTTVAGVPLILPNGASVSSNGQTVVVSSSSPFSPAYSIKNNSPTSESSQLSVNLGSGIGRSDLTTMLLTDGPDCTIECWVYITTTSGYDQIFGNWEHSDTITSGAFQWYLSGGIMNIQFGTQHYVGTNAIPTNVWRHIAWVRHTGKWHTFIHGNIDNGLGATLGTVSGLQPNVGFLKTQSTQGFGFRSYLDEFRIVTDKALYTGTSYTVPTERFPNQVYLD